MDLTAGTKTTAITAAVVMVTGTAVILYGVLHNDLARALGGACLTMTALTLLALIAIRRWITDASEERRVLAAATREAQAERTRYIAAQAALENEQGRLNRDMAAERARAAATLISDREALAAEFEEKRNQLIRDAMTEAWLIFTSDKTAQHPATENKVIQFPMPAPQHAAARSREHGIVGP